MTPKWEDPEETAAWGRGKRRTTLPVDVLVEDAVRRIVGRDFADEDPATLQLIVEDEIENFTVRSWRQTWGSTAGPFGGIGGQALTGFRVTTVLVGRTLAVYVGGSHWRDLVAEGPTAQRCLREGILDA